MRNLISGIVSGVCLAVLIYLLKPELHYWYIGSMNGIPPTVESLPPLLRESLDNG